MASSIARRFGTGSAPGRPRQTGHTSVFGEAPNQRAWQPQNIFDSVLSSTWVSIPMTSSYGAALTSLTWRLDRWRRRRSAAFERDDQSIEVDHEAIRAHRDKISVEPSRRVLYRIPSPVEAEEATRRGVAKRDVTDLLAGDPPLDWTRPQPETGRPHRADGEPARTGPRQPDAARLVDERRANRIRKHTCSTDIRRRQRAQREHEPTAEHESRRPGELRRRRQ